MTEYSLLEAAIGGDYNGVHHILQQNPFSPEQLGNVLCVKEVRENIFMVELLLQYGADANSYKTSYEGDLLNYACQKGSISLLKLALQYGANVNVILQSSPLYVACAHGHASCVQLLLEHGAKVDIDSGYYSPLKSINSAQILKMLIAHGIELNSYGNTLLHRMCNIGNVDAIEVLLKQGVDVHTVNNKSHTPLHTVIYHSPPKAAACLQLLIDYGSDMYMDMFEHYSPLSIACITGQVQCVEVLLRNGDYTDRTVTIEDVKEHLFNTVVIEEKVQCVIMVLAAGVNITVAKAIGDEMLLPMCRHASKATLTQFLQQVDRSQMSCFSVLECGNLDWLELVLQLGVNPNALHGNRLPLCKAIEMENMKLIELLIKYEVDVNAYDVITGNTPLLVAVKHRNMTVVELLLKHGKVNVNLAQQYGRSIKHYDEEDESSNNQPTFGDCEGCTPLSAACWNRDIECVKLLLKHGADPNCVINSSCLLAHAISEDTSGELVKILMENGACVNMTKRMYCESPLQAAVKQNNIAMVKTLLTHEADINNNVWCGTPLHTAVECNNMDMIQFLLENGADINALSSAGKTPLHIAVTNKRLNCLKILLSNGANIHASSHGNSPLHEACRLGDSFDIIEVLLLHGADENGVNDNNETPLHLAINKLSKSHNVDTIELLLRNGADVYKLDHMKRSPLYIACAEYNLHQVKALLKYIPDINVFKADYRGEVLTMNAIQNAQILEALVNHGLKLPITQICNSSTAWKSPAMANYLDEKNTLLAACRFGDATTVERLLLNSDSSTLNSALIVACSNGHVSCVEILLHHGAVVSNDSNLLYRACEHNMTEIARLLLRSVGAWDRSASASASVSASDLSCHQLINTQVNGVTTLMVAARKGYDGIVRLLIDAGANLDGYESISPLFIAIMCGNDKIVNMLHNTQETKRMKDEDTLDRAKRQREK